MTAPTPAYDFAAALDAQAETPFGTHRQGGLEIQHLNETIRFALRLADKLLGQEPSEGMLDASFDAYWKSRSSKEVNEQANMSFTAMIEQAVKEIENGTAS